MKKDDLMLSSIRDGSVEVQGGRDGLSQDQLQMLLMWFSPSFPVGSFAYSHGLEMAVEKGAVTDSSHLKSWLETVLMHGSGRSEGVIFCEAYKATIEGARVRLGDIDDLSNALLPTEELALESRTQGEAFIKAVQQMGAEQVDFFDQIQTYPVAVAIACALQRIPLNASLTSWYHSLATSLVSAGVRLIPLGQTQGLQVLASFSEITSRACRQAQTLTLDEIGSSAPLIDIDSMHHETQYTRLFRS